MGQNCPKISIIPLMGIHFLAITQPFLSNLAEIFYGYSRDYYLLMGCDKSWFWCIFWKKSNFGKKWAWPPQWCQGSGASRPDQNVDPLSGPFGSTVIWKTCFQKFRAWSLKNYRRNGIVYKTLYSRNVNLSFYVCKVVTKLAFFCPWLKSAVSYLT